MPDTFTKDPAEVLDYLFDFAAGHPGPYLEADETITDHAVTAPTGIDIDRTTATDTAVTAWLSGGTARTQYRVVCRVTTSAGRQAERSIAINVRPR